MRSAFPLDMPDELIPKHPNDSYIPPASTDTKKGKESSANPIRELDYVKLINQCLPASIRVIGWSEVSADFSARFSATYRQYRYYFMKKNLNIDRMRTAAQYLIGNHDFRNFCKLDVENVTNFVREIFEIDIRVAMNAIVPNSTDSPSQYKGKTAHHIFIKESIEHDILLTRNTLAISCINTPRICDMYSRVLS